MAGRISRVIDVHVFEVAGNSPASAVLVIDPTRRRPADVGEHVEVSGTVQPFRRRVLEAEFGLRFGSGVEVLEGRECMVTGR